MPRITLPAPREANLHLGLSVKAKLVCAHSRDDLDVRLVEIDIGLVAGLAGRDLRKVISRGGCATAERDARGAPTMAAGAPEFTRWAGPDAARFDRPMSHGVDTRDRAWKARSGYERGTCT